MRHLLKELFTRRSAIVALVLVGAFVGVLIAEGRPAMCKSGFGLWSAAWTSCTSQNLLDPYSITHVLHGVIFFWLLQPLAGRVSLPWRMIAAMALEIGWELLENSPGVIARYRQDTAALDYTGDSIINAVGDLASAIVGFAIASRFSWKVAVVLFVVLEVWLLWAIRDNLTLNVLMLVQPNDAIRDWQLSGLGLPLPPR